VKRPWMPLYIADFLRKTTHLDAMESGAYLLLIMDYWQNDSLPTDDKRLARIAKLTDRQWRDAKATLQAFFHDGWKHDRIDAEIAHASDVSEKRKKAVSTREQKKQQNEITSSSNDASVDYTLHTTQRKEDLAPDGTSSSDKVYAFESGKIRLNQRDFDLWKASFTHIDVGAELLGMTEWAGQQRSWFNAVKGALAKKNQQAKERKAQGETFKWNGIEGVI
jgi:uncharacterized protein YdaU (DUF1376 family)